MLASSRHVLGLRRAERARSQSIPELCWVNSNRESSFFATTSFGESRRTACARPSVPRELPGACKLQQGRLRSRSVMGEWTALEPSLSLL
jgi:hypothetical protein